MKLAASYALANLAKQPVLDEINEIYNTKLVFSKDYIIPKPFDKRLIVEVSSAVALAAVESSVARITNFDYNEYRNKLKKMI